MLLNALSFRVLTNHNKSYLQDLAQLKANSADKITLWVHNFPEILGFEVLIIFNFCCSSFLK